MSLSILNRKEAMTNEVSTFEASVRDRLKSIVAELIPEDRWDAIVHSTVQQFETIDLPKLIKAELEARYREVIRDEFNKPEWVSYWSDGQEQASQKVKELMVEVAPYILSSMFGGAMQQIVSQIRYSMQR